MQKWAAELLLISQEAVAVVVAAELAQQVRQEQRDHKGQQVRQAQRDHKAQQEQQAFKEQQVQAAH